MKLTVSTILTICHVRSQRCFDLHSSLVPIAVGATWEYRTASQVSWNMKSTSPVGLSVSLVYIPPTKSILPNSVKKANKTRIKDNKWLVQRRIYLESDFQYIQVKVSHQDWPASLVHCVPICFRYTCFTHTQPPKMFIDSVQISSKHQVCWLITIYLKLVGWQHLWRPCKQHVCWRYNSLLSSMTRRAVPKHHETLGAFTSAESNLCLSKNFCVFIHLRWVKLFFSTNMFFDYSEVTILG